MNMKMNMILMDDLTRRERTMYTMVTLITFPYYTHLAL